MIQKDQHDAIDFTDNSISVLANLPLMRRLRTLHLANNRIMSISPSLHLSCPGLTTLVLTNNNIAQLGDLEPLKELKYLQFLSLMGNPVGEQKYYREWVIFRCKALRVLDFQRIRDKVCLPFRILRQPTNLSAGAQACPEALLDTGLARNRARKSTSSHRHYKCRKSSGRGNAGRAASRAIWRGHRWKRRASYDSRGKSPHQDCNRKGIKC